MKPVYKEKYPHLFEPMYVGRNKVRFNNRVRVAPIGTGATGGGEDSDGRINTFGIDFWMRFIQGGFSSVALPMEVPIDGSHEHCFNLNPKTCNQMNFQRFQRAVHAFNGRTFAEFIHGGPYMRAGFKKISADDEPHLGSRAATREDLEEVARLFGEYAHWAQIANFDGLMLHFAHGWLINYFLSPLTNHRTDEYGGSAENRARFAVEAVSAVHAAVPGMPIDYKLAVRQENPHFGNAGVVEEELPVFVPLLEQAGVTSFHVTLANHSALENTIPPADHPYFSQPGCFLKFCDEVRQYTELPICGVGGLNDPDLVEQQLASGRIQCAAMSRQLLADPDWVNKLKNGQAEQIHRCLRCNKKCLGGLTAHQGTRCVYDALREKEAKNA